MDIIQQAILRELEVAQGFNLRHDQVVSLVHQETGAALVVIEKQIDYLSREGVIKQQTDGPWQVLSSVQGEQ